MDQVSIKYTSSIAKPSKIYQIWIFGLKTNHLATLRLDEPKKKIPGERRERRRFGFCVNCEQKFR
jgi:hypothetical protein